MMIETSEQYQAALARLCELGEAPATGDDQNEYLDISAAMVEYETRNHPAIQDRVERDSSMP